jgi:hypothetical protein
MAHAAGNVNWLTAGWHWDAILWLPPGVSIALRSDCAPLCV